MTEGVIDGYEYQYPHCDSRVLHAPGECEYCDHFPTAQQVRLKKRVCFTGVSKLDMAERYSSYSRYPSEWHTCPADESRPPGSDRDHRRWGGNKPKRYGATSAVIEGYPEETFASRVMYGEPEDRYEDEDEESVYDALYRQLGEEEEYELDRVCKLGRSFGWGWYCTREAGHENPCCVRATRLRKLVMWVKTGVWWP